MLEWWKRAIAALRMRVFIGRMGSFVFYAGLDIAVGVIIYVVSSEEIDLTPGNMMLRIMTAIMLANGIVGGPDIMIFWRESGRRVAAEMERDAVRQELAERNEELSKRNQELSKRNQELSRRDQELSIRNQELGERDQELGERNQEISELRALIADLQERVAAQERRASRARRRRPLRDDGK